MRVFIDEFLTSGGLLSAPDWGDCDSLAREGAAMAQAVAADLARIEGLKVVIKRDARRSGLRFPACITVDVGSAAEEASRFDQLAAEADWTLVIAPEMDGILLRRCQQVIASGGRLLGPGLELIALASDKHATAEFLSQAGIPVPNGVRVAASEPLPTDFPYPAVLKPCDGAGSFGIRFINCAAEAATLRVDRISRLETFHPGQACSIGLICSQASITSLPPFRQQLTTDGTFRYLGGESLHDAALADRARALGERVGAVLPAARGYVGLDLVLGSACDGSLDRLIEVNPRLTTSYLGLRQLTKDNLAAAMLSAVSERPFTLRWDRGRAAFQSDGSSADVFFD